MQVLTMAAPSGTNPHPLHFPWVKSRRRRTRVVILSGLIPLWKAILFRFSHLKLGGCTPNSIGTQLLLTSRNRIYSEIENKALVQFSKKTTLIISLYESRKKPEVYTKYRFMFMRSRQIMKQNNEIIRRSFLFADYSEVSKFQISDFPLNWSL